jgi:Protein of unknown function (DUF2778)
VGDGLVGLGVRAIPFGIVALGLGFILKSPGTQAGPADIGLREPGISVFGTIHPDIYRLRAPLGSGLPDAPIRLASLDPHAGFEAYANGRGMDRAACQSASYEYDGPASFDKRFASADDCQASFGESFMSAMQALASNLRLPADSHIESSARLYEASVETSPAMAAAKNRHVRPGRVHTDSVAASPSEAAVAASGVGTDDDGRIAIYDISAAAVYLPGGRKLEAHSGIGELRDNPRHAHKRMRGATPPNVYKLALRERLFHGVRALRLTPIDEKKMYGRDGILAHSYLLGPKGNSHGCVAFRNYPEFLNAFLKGEVTRIVVVERLESPPDKLAAGQLPDEARAMLSKTADRSRQVAAAAAAQ